MEQFAKMLKGKMNPSKMANLGFNQEQYKDLLAKQVKAITGMSEGVNADGGFTVPVEYASTVIEFAIQQSAILSSVYRVPMKSNSAKWPRLAQTDDSFFGGFAFDWIDEGTTKSNHKVTFEQVTFTAHKAAALCVLTDELIEDSLINIVNYITALASRAWMYELENVVIDGSGVGQPLGISNDPVVVANAVARTSAGAVSDTDLYNLEGAMNENFTNLSWMLRRSTLTKIRSLKDTTGQPIFHENWGSFGSTPTRIPTILSYPFHVSRNVSSIGHRGDIILGDLSHYMLAMRKEMSIDVSPYPYFTTDETVLRFVARIDGKPGTPYAFKMLAGTGS
jgi:HK97 family phage major capsid protein